MNYNSLFNLLYSTEISEDTKSDIISRIELPILEAKKHIVFKQDLEDAAIRRLKKENPNTMYLEDEYLDLDGSQAAQRKRMEKQVSKNEALVETYLELLDTLVYSSASESLIYNIIDETFAELDEEFINEVSDQWVKRKTEAGLKAREQAYKQAKSNVVGLSSLNKAAEAGEKLERGKQQVANRTKVTPLYTKPTAVDKLKSAVGKVKNWASSIDKGPEHVGLSRIVGYKANKDNMGAHSLHQQTTQKAEAPSARSERIEKAKEKAKGTKLPSGDTINMDNSSIKRREEAKEKAKGTKLPSGDTINMDNSSIKKKEKAKEKAKGTKLPSGDTINMDNSSIKRREEAKEKAKGTKLPSGDTIEMGARKEKVDALKKAAKVKTERHEEKATKPIKSSPDETLKKVKEAGEKISKQLQAKKKKVSKPKKVTAETQPEKQEEVETPKSKKTRAKKEKVEQPKVEAPKAETKQPEIKSEVNAEDATKAVKKATKGTKKKANNETIKNAKKKVAEITGNKPEEKVETKAEEKAESKAEKSSFDKFSASLRRQQAQKRKDQEKVLQDLRGRRQQMTSKPGYDTKTVQDLDKRISDLEKTLGATKTNEALSELAYLLAHTNISESSFVEVMKMTIDKAKAEEIKDRYDSEIEESIDAIYKDIQEGKDIDPEKTQKTEKLLERKEHFEELFNKKFSNIN